MFPFHSQAFFRLPLKTRLWSSIGTFKFSKARFTKALLLSLLRPQYRLLMEGLYIAAIATFLALRQNLQLERKEELWDSWAV